MNATITNPYIGPRTFRKEDADRFYGREREVFDLLGLIKSEQLLLFYAQSGAGKSSLINARVIPELEVEGFEVLPIARVSGVTPEDSEIENPYTYNLVQGLVQLNTTETPVYRLSLADLLEGLHYDETGTVFSEERLPETDHKGIDDMPRRLVLIIDQFEELFTTHPEAWDKRGDFFNQLAQAIREYPALSIVLVTRGEYLGELDPFAYLLPNGLRIRYYMQRLSHVAALEAVKGPVQSIRPFAEGVAEKLIDDLSAIRIQRSDGTIQIARGEFIEPVQLQVVCQSLWGGLPSDGIQITDRDLQAVGSVNLSLENYYASRVREVAVLKGVNERSIREWFGRALITVDKTRNLVARELRTKPGRLSDDVIREFVGDLVRAELRGGAVFYELTHDRFVEPIIENNRNWLDANLSPLQKSADLWHTQGRPEGMLLRGSALESAIQNAQMGLETLSPGEQDFLAASMRVASLEQRERRGNMLVRVMAIGASLSIIAAVYFVNQMFTGGAQGVFGYIIAIFSSLLLGYFLGRRTK